MFMRGRTARIGVSAAAWLACAGCGQDVEGEAPEPARLWGVEEREVAAVGVNQEDPNTGWACGLERCSPRRGEHEVEPRVGTCAERGWVIGEDGARELAWDWEGEFDASGRLMRSSDAAYSYEGGKLVEVVGEDYTITFGYDDSGALVSRIEEGPDGEYDHVTYTYDTRGRITSRASRSGDDPEPDVTRYTYPNDSTQLEWFTEETSGSGWHQRTSFDALGRRDLIVINSPAFGYTTNQYVYEGGRVAAYVRIGEPAMAHFTVDYDAQGRPARIGESVTEGTNDYGVFTRRERSITLEVFGTRVGEERPVYVYELEGEACERGTIEGERGWLSLVRRGILSACGSLPCREEVSNPR